MRKIVHVRMWLKKQGKKCDESKNAENKRFLISVKVVGSAGPLRFIVSESDSVKRVINSALKLYTRQGRLPVLTSGANSFLLFPANAELSGIHLSLNLNH
ncbi:hypothetical protein Leryth_025389 [Lithospermum erythrorhizon]|uniref:DUF7054 domain-containing protein n=1 Tax=Lithospermum erythrorhizon TaxID=34254 RepID=A0AAV3QA86_LITER|nr:hypothetical protein Leryth_025389 [Lithospermum erythrorhizon]